MSEKHPFELLAGAIQECRKPITQKLIKNLDNEVVIDQTSNNIPTRITYLRKDDGSWDMKIEILEL